MASSKGPLSACESDSRDPRKATVIFIATSTQKLRTIRAFLDTNSARLLRFAIGSKKPLG